MTTKKVFVVTHQRGFEADPIIDILVQEEIPVFRFNGNDDQNSSQISLMIREDGLDVSFCCDGSEIRQSEIGVGWCQQLPPYLGQASSIEESLQRENLWEAQRAAYELLGNIPWLNSPQKVISASCKPWQLFQAMSLGFRISRTIISNKPEDIRRFCLKQATIAKNLATPWVIEKGGEVNAAYTQLVKPEWLEDDDELAFCPVIYQEFCKRRRDYRVTAIAGKFFAVCCEPKSGQEEDIRLDSTTGEAYRPCELESPILAKLQQLMDRLGLQYCGADFMEDEEGNLYFLEMNTCGAWWWVDDLYGGAIGRAIADYLKSQLATV